jgi:hypothetical protein
MARLTENLHFAAAEDRALQLCAEALEMADRLGIPDALIAAQLARHAAHFHIEHVHERLEVMAELHRLARETGHSDLSGHALQWTIYAQLELGALADARETLGRLAALAQDLHEPRYDYIARTWRVTFALLDEAPEEAERLAMAAYELAPRVQGIDANAIAGAQMLYIRRAQGRLEEILPALRSLVDAIPLLWGRSALTLVLAETGRLEEARSAWETLVGGGLASIPRDMWWLVTMATLAETAHLLGDAPRAAALYSLLAPYAERSAQLVFTAHLGPVERHLGLLAATSAASDS